MFPPLDFGNPSVSLPLPVIRRITAELLDERPRRKSCRPWRNRAIIYLLIETGMRRAAVTRLNLTDIDHDRQAVSVLEKGGLTHRYQISRQGLKAISDDLEHERIHDADCWTASEALFLPADSKPQSPGRLNPVNINAIWNETCALARVKGRTPHSACHAMGRHILEKTGNVAAVQRQLGHYYTYRVALSVFEPAKATYYVSGTQNNLEHAQALLEERRGL